MGRSRNGSIPGGQVTTSDEVGRNTTPRNYKITEELGKTGLKQYGGTVYEEFLPQLQGGRGMRVYGEMTANDAIINAVLFIIEMLLRRVEWMVPPVSDKQADVDAAEFLEQNMQDMEMSWPDTVAEILGMLPYGWSFHEQLWKIREGENQGDPTRHSKFDDGRFGWRGFPVRSQESLIRWEWEGSQLVGMTQRIEGWQERTIPMEKGMLFRTTVRRNNPEGRSILRGAYRSWHFKKRIEEVEGIGVERDLAGLPKLQAPEGVNLWDTTNAQAQQQLNMANQMVRGVRRDEYEGIVLPPGWDFDLVASGGSRQLDVGKIIERYDRRIAMVVVADVILLGHERVGSFALASSKTNLFAAGLGAWLDMIAAVVNATAVRKLFELNNFPGITEVPSIQHGDIESQDLAEISDYVSKLSAAGLLTPGPEIEEFLRKLAGLPKKPEEDPDDTVDDDEQDDEEEIPEEELGNVVDLATRIRDQVSMTQAPAKFLKADGSEDTSITCPNLYEAARRLGYSKPKAKRIMQQMAANPEVYECH